MSAGELRHRMAFEKRTAEDDGAGNVVSGDWTVQFECAAGIKLLIGSETVLAARLEGRQPAIIKVRVSEDTKGIDTDWRARDVRDGAIYNIRTKANNDQKSRYFEMMAETGVAT